MGVEGLIPAGAPADVLAGAYAANLHALFRTMAGLDGGLLIEEPGLSRHSAFPGNPMFTGAWAPEPGSAPGADAVPGLVEWFRGRGVPAAFVWTPGPAEPPLAAALDAAGLVPFETDAPILAADIAALRWDAPRPRELRIAIVRDEAGVRDWAEVFAESFGIPPVFAQAWVEATLSFGVERAPWRMLVGRLGGRPVASAMLFCGAGVAGLIQMGVVHEARRQGVGSAMQLERVRIAREEGYECAVLSAAAMGVSPYTALGFRDTGARIGRYLWRADTDLGGRDPGRTWTEGN